MRPKVKVSTALELARVFWPDFVQVENSIFLSGQIVTPLSDPEHGMDYTRTEVFGSHTHMIDLFKHGADRLPVNEDDDAFYDQNHPDFGLLCEVGKKMAQMWFQKLKQDFPQYRFRIYYTQEDNPIVRFHRVRPDEPYWIDEGSWAEDIRLGKVIIYDTGE